MWFPNSTKSFDSRARAVFLINGCNSTDNTLTPLPSISPQNILPPFNVTIDLTEEGCDSTNGDDDSPPNAVKVENMNCLALLSSSSAGWSDAAPRAHFDPTSLTYELTVNSDLSLNVLATFEYSNPFANDKQSMVVRLSVLKQFMSENRELQLVSTAFEDLMEKGEWKDISTDVTFTENAEEIVQAVMQNKTCGQTAGLASSKAESIDVKLGPVARRGRIKLSFTCREMYHYDAMSVSSDPTDVGQNQVVPLGVFLPWTKLGDAAGNIEITLIVKTPAGSGVLCPTQSHDTYLHLKQQALMKNTALIVVDKLNPDGAFLRTWHCLPPTQCCILFWLEMPVAVDDYVDVAAELEMLSTSPVTKLDIYCPTLEDTSILKVSMPGAPSPDAQLFRMKVKLPEIGRLPSTKVRSVINLNFSDASGSTGRNVMTSSSGAVMGKESKKTIRDCFNMFGERRFLKRLSSIPALLHANVLRKEDIWTDVTYAFDHGPVDTFSLTFLVGDLVDQVFVDNIVAAAQITHNADNQSSNLMKTGLLDTDKHGVLQNVMSKTVGCSVMNYLKRLRMIQSNGGTDFKRTAMKAVDHFNSLQSSIEKLLLDPTIVPLVTSFVDFDTDGGHNGSLFGCFEAVDEMVAKYKVCNGVVYGFGDWLNQDCASKLARRIGSVPALLALHIPEPGQEGLNVLFRRGFSAWLDSLRSIPMKVTISAGSVAYSHGSRGTRHLNAIEVIAARGTKCLRRPMFSSPDVSDVHSTKAVVECLCGGDEVVFLVASRIHDPNTLSTCMTLDIGEDQTSNVELKTFVQQEPLVGCSLAHEWLGVLSTRLPPKTKEVGDLSFNSTVAIPRLLAKMEDDVAFSFNLVSPSGATSYLGRSNTNLDRAPINAAHEPSDPSENLNIRTKSVQYDTWHSFGAPQVLCSSQPLTSQAYTNRSPAIAAFSCRAPTLKAAYLPLGVRSSSRHEAKRQCEGLDASSTVVVESKVKFASPSKILIGSDFLRTHISKQVGDVGATIHFSCNMLTNNVQVLQFSCNCCSQSIPKDARRFHCMFCEDYDECVSCAGSHTRSHPLHVLVDRGDVPVLHTQSNGVLLNQLLGPAAGRVDILPTNSNQSQPLDHALEVCEQRVCFLLASMLQWWPIVNDTYTNGNCPTELDAEISSQIRLVLSMSHESLERIASMCSLAITIVDSLGRIIHQSNSVA
mmetsp:Transcript_21175/g.29367  ORF Transcript_21175/g.29367 Transcript_21175/m.29367 type:complete len:1191 (-) Transcript_21175:109-3681(-)